MSETTSSNAMKTAARAAKRAGRLGNAPRCRCGESDLRTLSVICAECLARRDGRSLTERHHLAGRSNSAVTAAIPANEHRILSDMQQDWPARTVRNPDHSPLLRASAAIRAMMDYLKLMIDRLIGPIPQFLEALDRFLIESMGDEIWEKFRQWLTSTPESTGLLIYCQ